MKFLLVHNQYGSPAGEEAIIDKVQCLLREMGHEVVSFFRSSAEIDGMAFGKTRAFFSGIHSWSSRRAIRHNLGLHKPDVVIVHNVFPFISPFALVECRRAGVPVVMSVNNYRLICPNGLFLTHGEICERCAGGREYWCILRNCERHMCKSIGYALRNAVARWGRAFTDNVSAYAVFTEFQRQKLISEGFPPEKIFVIPNLVHVRDLKNGTIDGEYAGCVGRISPEKGTSVFVEAAKQCPQIHFRTTGSTTRMPHLVQEAPDNFNFAGYVDDDQLEEFYVHSRFIVVPTLCYEGFPSVCVEAMMFGKPVIASRIGGMPEIIDDGITGFVFEPGNANELAEKIRHLWSRPQLCRELGQAGREKALCEYSSQKYYERLMNTCHTVQ